MSNTQARRFSRISLKFLILVGASTVLLAGIPWISWSQTPPDQSPTNGVPSSAPKEKTSPSPEEAPSDILLIMKEENESISRGLGQEQPISEAPSNVYV